MIEFKEITPFIHLVVSDKKTPWKCNGLVIRSEKGNSVFIDCNFDDNELERLIAFTSSKPLRYYVTHVHVDHVLNVHRIEKLNIPVFCPEPEDRYIVNVKKLIEHSGALKYGVKREMEDFLFKFVKLENLNTVNSFTEKDHFIFDNIIIKPVHLPGHSPGHTGFIIEDCRREYRPVLFSTDIGIEKIGAWYGFEYCNVTEIKESLGKIEKIYSEDNYILIGSHSDIISEKDPSVLREVADKIEKCRIKIISKMDKNGSVSPDELVFKGIYYRESSIEKMDEISKRLYFFWEGFTIRNLLDDLENDGLIEKTDKERWGISHRISYDYNSISL